MPTWVIVVADNDTRKVLGLVIPDQTKRWATDAGGPFYPSLSVMLADDPWFVVRR